MSAFDSLLASSSPAARKPRKVKLGEQRLAALVALGDGALELTLEAALDLAADQRVDRNGNVTSHAQTIGVMNDAACLRYYYANGGTFTVDILLGILRADTYVSRVLTHPSKKMRR